MRYYRLMVGLQEFRFASRLMLQMFCCRQHFPADVAKQAEEPLYFADFLREPVLDPDTGEPLEVQPKYYESFCGGLPAIRYPPLLLPAPSLPSCCRRFGLYFLVQDMNFNPHL